MYFCLQNVDGKRREKKTVKDSINSNDRCEFAEKISLKK